MIELEEVKVEHNNEDYNNGDLIQNNGETIVDYFLFFKFFFLKIFKSFFIFLIFQTKKHLFNVLV